MIVYALEFYRFFVKIVFLFAIIVKSACLLWITVKLISVKVNLL